MNAHQRRKAKRAGRPVVRRSNREKLRMMLTSAPANVQQYFYYSPPLTAAQRATVDAICAECGWRVRELPGYMAFDMGCDLMLERVS